LIFADILILCVHEIGPFVPSSSVFIQLMLCALYRMISKHAKIFFGKKNLNVPTVKLNKLSTNMDLLSRNVHVNVPAPKAVSS
jgi:hypothetical protein